MSRVLHAGDEKAEVRPAAGRSDTPLADGGEARQMERWLGLSDARKSALEVLITAVNDVSGLIDTNIGDLSRRFQVLAQTSRDQMGSVQRLAGNVNAVVARNDAGSEAMVERMRADCKLGDITHKRALRLGRDVPPEADPRADDDGIELF